MEREFLDRLSLALLRGRTLTLQNSRSRHAKRIVEGEFFTADVESIEGVGAVGAMFEQVFFLRYATKAASR